MSVFSRLNSISIMQKKTSLDELIYNLFCSECNGKIMKKLFSELNEIICYSCYMVDLHYGTCGTIHAGKRYFSSLIMNPELHDCINETLSIEELGVIVCQRLNLKEIEYYKNGKKALELMNA